MYKYEFYIIDEFCYDTDLVDEFEYAFEFTQLTTDAATGQTRLFEGGYFNPNGVFVNTGSWDS